MFGYDAGTAMQLLIYIPDWQFTILA